MSSPPNTNSNNSQAQKDGAIRARLLNRLGIHNGPPSSTHSIGATPMTAAQHRQQRLLRGMGVGHQASSIMQVSPPDGSIQRSTLRGVVHTKERLNDDGMTDAYSNNNSVGGLTFSVSPNSEVALNPKRSIRIGFSDEVDVCTIPTRYEYSDRIKSRIWSNRHELQENAERNTLEFAAEGWNWRNVIDDEGMYICSISGELVHPVHCQHLVAAEDQVPVPTGPPPMQRADSVNLVK